MQKTYISKSGEETQKIASEIIKDLKGRNIIFLYGDLGAGKTTFTQGVAKYFGIKEKVQSPTFVIRKEYDIIRQSNTHLKKVVHIDLYRLKGDDEIIRELLEEFSNKEKLFLIEWPDRLKSFDLKKVFKIEMKHIGKDERKIITESC